MTKSEARVISEVFADLEPDFFAQIIVATQTDIKYQIMDNMDQYGGSFVKALSQCIRHADNSNLFKLAVTFTDYFKQYLPHKWEHESRNTN